MAVRKFKPVTPGQRHKIIGVFRNEIAIAKPAEGAEKVKKVSKITPEKSLVVGKRSTGGRNSSGHLSTRYRGVATRENCVSLISREQTTVYPQQLRASSMILTVRLVSRSFTTQTAPRLT